MALLLFSTIPRTAQAAGALFLLVMGTALSMALLCTAFGLAIAGGLVSRTFERVAPVLGILGMAFGAWYTPGALELLVYTF